MKHLVLLFILILIYPFTGSSQVSGKDEIVQVDGKSYLLYKVEKGETIFSICKTFDVDQKDLVGANPQLIFGLKEGDVLKVPFKKEVRSEQVIPQLNKDHSGEEVLNENETERFIFHVVKKSETIYSLSKKYNIPIQAIYKFNPEARHSILENEIVRIPTTSELEEVDGLVREDERFYYHRVQAGENLYSLAKRYHSAVTAIYEYNQEIEGQLDVGMIIRIPKLEQKQEDEKEQVPEGKYFTHRIESGDTFYSYQRRFGVSQKQLVQLNPELNDGLLAGLEIKIPLKEEKKIERISIDKSAFDTHKVEKGETLYSLSRRYQINVLDIKNVNPELKVRGLVAGEEILIPHKEKTEAPEQEIEEDEIRKEEPDAGKKKEPKEPRIVFDLRKKQELACQSNFKEIEDDTFRIAMFLPLFFDENEEINLVKKSEEELAELDSLAASDPLVFRAHYRIQRDSLGGVVDTVLVDSMKVQEFRTFFRGTEFFLNFYEGFLLGLDSMQNTGLKLSLSLYDTQMDSKVIDSILYTQDLINVDLIVGPVYASIQNSVSDFSAKNGIPMVSPLDNNVAHLFNNPFYFQINPSKDYQLRKTADFIGDAYYDKNFVIISFENQDEEKEDQLVSLVREKFFSSGEYRNQNDVLFTVVEFPNDVNWSYWQVKKTLRSDMENVIFVPAPDDPERREAMLSRAINDLKVLSQEFDIILLGMSDYPTFSSINAEYFHLLQLNYLTANYVDYSAQDVKRFVSRYRETFKVEPHQLFSFRGYDVCMFFLGAYRLMGDDFMDCVSDYHPDLLQGDYNFQKIDKYSGYMNHTLFIMQYTKDFEQDLLTKISEGRLVLD